MAAYIVRRILFAVVLVFLATVVSFVIIRASPGEAGAGEFNPRMSQEFYRERNEIFGLDQPPIKQYLNWLGALKLVGKSDRPGILQGNLGDSIEFQEPVSKVIASRLPATLALNLITLLFTWTVAIPLGTYAAVKKYRWPDKFLSFFSFTGMSLPGFFLALLILWGFASHLQILPAGGLTSMGHDSMSFFGKAADYAKHLIVPVAVLTIGALAGLQRITRGNMLGTLRQQYITTARAKGLSETKVIYKHALRNAINPLVTLLGFEFAGLFGGAALLENVINYPGMGQLLLESLRAKDQQLVMSAFLIGSILLVIGNLVAELLLVWVDPRISYA